MPLSTNIITTTTAPLLFSSLPFHLYNMSMNQLAQNPSQAWTSLPTMDSHHHYFQVEQVQQGNYGREHMFEKPLTPSDVGKLNRLVIPKQHAEKYFPLDSESGEKGLLLSFEDESGKQWKFRYSYWSSSQSYVLTKGWSRYVKEKKLDAGDVVLFERLRLRSSDDRLYIGCRRYKFNETTAAAASSVQDAVRSNAAAALPWSPTFYAQAASSPYPTPYYYMNSVEQTGSSGESSAAATATATTGNSRRLRLFGVNLECGPDPAESQHFVSDSWN